MSRLRPHPSSGFSRLLPGSVDEAFEIVYDCNTSISRLQHLTLSSVVKACGSIAINDDLEGLIDLSSKAAVAHN